jgi:hypothetical protein
MKKDHKFSKALNETALQAKEDMERRRRSSILAGKDDSQNFVFWNQEKHRNTITNLNFHDVINKKFDITDDWLKPSVNEKPIFIQEHDDGRDHMRKITKKINDKR